MDIKIKKLDITEDVFLRYSKDVRNLDSIQICNKVPVYIIAFITDTSLHVNINAINGDLIYSKIYNPTSSDNFNVESIFNDLFTTFKNVVGFSVI